MYKIKVKFKSGDKVEFKTSAFKIHNYIDAQSIIKIALVSEESIRTCCDYVKENIKSIEIKEVDS